MRTSDILTAVVAVYGAVLSTVAIVRQFVGEKVRVKVTVDRDMELIGDPRYVGMTLTMVRVTNFGRRPVNITSFGAVGLYPHKSLVAADTRPLLPCEITEGKFVDSVWDQAQFDLSTIDYWVVHDSHGRAYKVRSASWLKHWESSRKSRAVKRKNK